MSDLTPVEVDKLEEARVFHARCEYGIEQAGPEFQTCHMLLGTAIKQHDRLRSALQDICARGRNPIAEEALDI